MATVSVSIGDDAEAALERLFGDARLPAAHPNPLYDGRNLEEIDDDIELVRSELNIEL